MNSTYHFLACIRSAKTYFKTHHAQIRWIDLSNIPLMDCLHLMSTPRGRIRDWNLCPQLRKTLAMCVLKISSHSLFIIGVFFSFYIIKQLSFTIVFKYMFSKNTIYPFTKMVILQIIYIRVCLVLQDFLQNPPWSNPLEATNLTFVYIFYNTTLSCVWSSVDCAKLTSSYNQSCQFRAKHLHGRQTGFIIFTAPPHP